MPSIRRPGHRGRPASRANRGIPPIAGRRFSRSLCGLNLDQNHIRFTRFGGSWLRLGLAALAALGGLLLAGGAAADGGRTNFTCDTLHAPSAGATYRDFSVVGDCSITAEAITVTGNLTVSNHATLTIQDDGTINVGRNVSLNRGGISLFGKGTMHVGRNVSINQSVFNIGTSSYYEPITLTIGGNLRIHTGDFNDAEMNSTYTLEIDGNVTAVNPYNINILAGAYIPGMTAPSDVEIHGATTIRNDHSVFNVGGGTFGPITVRNINDVHAGVDILGATITGDLIVRNNHDFGTFLQGNTISGDLECTGNVPAPTNVAYLGGPIPNIVAGAETGQCVGL
jgi:hypothetical protein